MKTIATYTVLLCMLILSGCGRGPYRATAKILLERTDGTACDTMMLMDESPDIMGLAVPFLLDGAQMSVGCEEGASIIRITITDRSARKAADICNRIARAYIARPDSRFKKTLIEEATIPTEPL